MPLRVLLSEGSSTSSREAITILALAGHHVEVCDPTPWCIARFSRLVRKFHRCPPLRDDPKGYLAFVEQLLARGHFDILLPTHEQGFLFSRVALRLRDHVSFALPSFESYRAAHSKARFSALLAELGLPQPKTAIVSCAAELRRAISFPAAVKTAVGTASRGVWQVRDQCDLDRVTSELTATRAFSDAVLVQRWIAGSTEKAQSVFCRGKLTGFHAYRQIALGVGGGEAIKESVSRPAVREMLERIGGRLAWHGALSVDYLVPAHDPRPHLIDCNPRLVEPMNAYASGTDLVALLLDVSRGEAPAALPEGRAGVRTHLAIQALLGCAARGGSRRELMRESLRLWEGCAPYNASCEELTPLRADWMSAVPVGLTTLMLLASPHTAVALALGGFGAHLLSREGIRLIESEAFD